MTEFNMIFYTDYHLDGYQLGINFKINKEISSDDYQKLYKKIKFAFKNFNYEMDIVKITEMIQIILTNNGLKDETAELRISILNKFDNTQPTNIIGVKTGSLESIIYEYEFYKDREICVVGYKHGLLYKYFYKNINKEFIRQWSKVSFDYKELPEPPKRRYTLLKEFLETNLNTMEKLEEIRVPEVFNNINIEYSDSILVTAYRLFYGEEPNFNDPNIITKFQCMVALIHTNITDMISTDTDRNYNNSDIIKPESDYVNIQLFKLNLLLDTDFTAVNSWEIKPVIANKIKTLGEVVRNYLLQIPEEDRFDFLNKFTINVIQRKEISEIDKESKELILLLSKKEN